MEFGYIFERLCWLMYTSHVMWTALTNPNYFGHLTYWSLCLQSVYFTVDKGSPRAGPAICLFHGTATIGALAVMLGYTFMTVGGMYRFGSFLEWENAIGKYAGTIGADRTLPVLVAQKFYEHYWPVIVLLIDKSINRASLRSAYAGAGPLRTAALGMAGYLAVGSAWEQYSHRLGLGSALDVYQQPDEFKTERCLGRLGLGADGLPEDFVYNSFLKIFCIGGAGFLYWSLVPPLFKADGKAKAN